MLIDFPQQHDYADSPQFHVTGKSPIMSQAVAIICFASWFSSERVCSSTLTYFMTTSLKIY